MNVVVVFYCFGQHVSFREIKVLAGAPLALWALKLTWVRLSAGSDVLAPLRPSLDSVFATFFVVDSDHADLAGLRLGSSDKHLLGHVQLVP